MNPVTLRPLERKDLEAVLDMVIALNNNGTQIDPRYRMAQDGRAVMRQHMLDRWFAMFHPFPVGWVAQAENGLVGFLSGGVLQQNYIIERPPTALIGDLWVSPNHRRPGLGRRLVERYLEAAAKAGFDQVEVGTLTRDKRAVAFWRSLGFSDWRTSLCYSSTSASSTRQTSPSDSISQGSSSSISSVKK
ncbi:MAG: GNAT family N-acetyltransferase [Rhodobacterales bacterium]|nr:GNAT family N-acetyltransferase [Rhodobacterales bacterium]